MKIEGKGSSFGPCQAGNERLGDDFRLVDYRITELSSLKERGRSMTYC